MTKITVDSNSFVEAVQWATKSFDAKDDKAFVALKVSAAGRGSLSHSNPTSYLKNDFQILSSDLESGDEISLALEGRFLQRLAGALDAKGPADLEYKNNVLTLKSRSGKFTLPVFNSRLPKEPEFVKVGEVDDTEYFDSVQRLAKLTDVASAQLMPILGTVDIRPDLEENRLVMMATDRYSLGEISIDFTPSDENVDFFNKFENLLLPYESAVLIAPSKGLTSSVELIFSEEAGDKFGYRFADGRVALFSMKAAQPLQYEALKTNATNLVKNSVQLNTRDLQKAIATISNLAWDENEIYLEITPDVFAVHDSSRSNRLELETDDLSVEEPLTVKFVRSVINKGFVPISTAKLNLKFGGATDAFVFEPVLDTGAPAENVFVIAIPSS